MKKKITIILICLTAGVLTIAFAQTYSQTDFISLFIKPEKQKQCGIHKLSQEERNSLSNVFWAIFEVNKIGNSAVEYLKSEGWEEVEVIGTRMVRLDEDAEPEEYLIVKEGSQTYFLEPRNFSSLRPGKYLGQMGLTSCEIINSNGSTVRFWTKDKR